MVAHLDSQNTDKYTQPNPQWALGGQSVNAHPSVVVRPLPCLTLNEPLVVSAWLPFFTPRQAAVSDPFVSFSHHHSRSLFHLLTYHHRTLIVFFTLFFPPTGYLSPPTKTFSTVRLYTKHI